MKHRRILPIIKYSILLRMVSYVVRSEVQSLVGAILPLILTNVNLLAFYNYLHLHIFVWYYFTIFINYYYS